MPIYAYRCESCGFAKDVLQKISDPLLTDCPECGKPAFKKQLTAAGFQLKGTGWYATDFRGGSTPKTAENAAPGAATGLATSSESSKPADGSSTATPASSESKSGTGSSGANSSPTDKG